MPRRARRSALAPRIETLDARTLLSGASASWMIADPDPSSSVLVGFRPGTSAKAEAAIVKAAGAQVVTSYPGGPTLAITPSPTARAAAMKTLKSYVAVRYVEADATFHVDAVYPNDPGLSRQWGLNQSNNVDVDAPEAWSTTTGSASTIVAVIDSGLDTSHPDFAGRLWTNTAEANGAAGRDNDGDGLVGDVHGWDFLDNSPDISDDNGHGTHVTGILAANGNDGTGEAGLNWNARIMPLKFIGADGNGSVDDAVRAIYYAVDHGARVINASWGGGSHVQALTDAIAYANSRNVVFVTAAGNESVNNGSVRSYPADDRLPNVISVAALDANGHLAGFSNYGSTTVGIAAPGVNIRSDVPGGYATYSGTSMSSPYVAGVASLVIGLHPELTASQVVQRILNTVKPLPGLKNKLIAPGIVDAANAVSDAYAAAHSGANGKAHATKLQLHKAVVHRASHTPAKAHPAPTQKGH